VEKSASKKNKKSSKIKGLWEMMPRQQQSEETKLTFAERGIDLRF